MHEPDLLADEFTYAGLAEPVRLAMPPAWKPTSPRLRGRLFGASDYDWRADRCRAVGMGELVL